MNFDPLDYMNSADAANIQLQNAFDESKFKDITNLVMIDMDMKALLLLMMVMMMMEMTAMKVPVALTALMQLASPRRFFA